MTPPSPLSRISPLAAVVALVALVLIVAGLLVATLFAPAGRDTSLIVGVITSVIAPTIAALVALIRTDKTSRLVADVSAKVNGHLGVHEDLSRTVARSADAAAQALNTLTTGERDPGARTRATDEAQTPVAADYPLCGTLPSGPLADQT